ncbi:MAG: hypothetical protein WC641_06595 [Patescibacteria group bacterium]
MSEYPRPRETSSAVLASEPPVHQESDTTQLEAVRSKVAGLLKCGGVLSEEEIFDLKPKSIDELLVRCADDLPRLKEATPEQLEKIRRILGLHSSQGELSATLDRRSKEIRELETVMRSYLVAFQKNNPEVLGLVLCGSRMDAQKSPEGNSDVDTVVILKHGQAIDPKTPEGEKELFSLRNYSDTHPTQNGQPVELDALFPSDGFVEALNSLNEKSTLVWGWNPNAVRYIGDSVEDMNEDDVNTFLRLRLNSRAAELQRNRMVEEASKKLERAES